MANEIYNSGLSDVRLAQTLASELALILQDRFSLWGDPAIRYVGNAAQTGSAVIKVPLVGTGKMAAVAENAAVANTDLDTDSATITVARQALQHQISGLAEMVDSVGVAVPLLVQGQLSAAAVRFMEMLCAVGATFSEDAGSTGEDFDSDVWYEGVFGLMEAGVPGPHLAVLAPEQLTQLKSDLRGEVGPTQLRTDHQDLFTIAGAQGDRYTLNGVGIVTSQHVATVNTNTDRAGFIFGFGAIGYADGTPAPIRGAGEVVYPAGQQIFVELERDASANLTKVVGNYFCGVGLIEDARGLKFISKKK